MLAETAVESVQDVTIRRGWFASTLTVQTVQGVAFKVRGLNKHQASYVRGAMLDAAAVRAAAAAQELVKVDEALHRLLQRGRYVRYSEMLAVHEKLVSAVQQCGGLITRHLPASARDALGRLVSLESAESVDAVREDVNQRCVSASVPAVAAAADAALGARVTEEQAEPVGCGCGDEPGRAFCEQPRSGHRHRDIPTPRRARHPVSSPAWHRHIQRRLVVHQQPCQP